MPDRFILYDGLAPEQADLSALAGRVGELFGKDCVELRDDFFAHWVEKTGREVDRDALCRRMARARVHQPDRQAPDREPAPAELDYEDRFLTAGSDRPSGVLYDGNLVLGLCASLIAPEELGKHCCHIAFTPQFFGTWGGARYHARVAVFGMPTLISTSGAVQGPARPRQHYLARRIGGQMPGRDESGGDYLTSDDPRMQQVLEGYLIQALFYHIAGQPHCDDEPCRLFNAHWQEKMLRAQTGEDAGLCSQHRRMLESWTCE